MVFVAAFGGISKKKKSSMRIPLKKTNVHVVVVLESASNTVNTDMMGCFTASITKIFVLSFAFFYTEMIGIHHRDKRYTKVRRFLLIYLLLSNYER